MKISSEGLVIASSTVIVTAGALALYALVAPLAATEDPQAGKRQNAARGAEGGQKGNAVPGKPPVFSSPGGDAGPAEMRGSLSGNAGIDRAAAASGSRNVARRTAFVPWVSGIAEAVDQGTPGAHIATAGRIVTVESFTLLGGQPGSALNVVIEPEVAPSRERIRPSAGFSYEDELFRTRWGWAAYEAVRRAAANGGN